MEGRCDGASLGDEDGTALGFNDGAALALNGDADGAELGFELGRDEGRRDGSLVGPTDGLPLGVLDGSPDGISLGPEDGTKDGFGLTVGGSECDGEDDGCELAVGWCEVVGLALGRPDGAFDGTSEGVGVTRRLPVGISVGALVESSMSYVSPPSPATVVLVTHTGRPPIDSASQPHSQEHSLEEAPVLLNLFKYHNGASSPPFSTSRRRRVQFLGKSVGSSMPFVELPLRVTLISVNCTSFPSRLHVLLLSERLSFLVLLPLSLSAGQLPAMTMESTVNAWNLTQLLHDPSSTAVVTSALMAFFTLFVILF